VIIASGFFHERQRLTLLPEFIVMTADRAERLQAILAAIDNHIQALRDLGLDDTARILAIAKLDIQMKLHDISDEELKAFCEAVGSASHQLREAKVSDLRFRASRKG
jgi:UV DNA damage repair endonuclease